MTPFFRRLVVVPSLGSCLLSAPAWAQQEEKAPKSSPSEHDDTHELESIVVEGKLIPKPQTPSSTTTEVSEEQLEKNEDDNVHQIMLRVPGVQVRGEDGMGLRPNIGIRGTSPNRSAKVTLMEDGVLLGPAPYSAPAAYYFPMVTRMTSIEVLKGGSSLRFGPRALGGAIDFHTAAIPDSGARVYGDLAGGEYGYFKGHARTGYGSALSGFLLEGIRVSSTGFKELDGGGDTGFEKNEFMAKWRLNSGAAARIYQQLDLKFGYSTETSNETYLGLTDADFGNAPYRRYVSSSLDQMQWHRGQFQARYFVLFDDQVELSVTAYRNQFTRDWFKFDRFRGITTDEVLANPDSPANRIYYDVLAGRENSSGPDETLLLADNYRYYVSQGIASKLIVGADTGPLHHTIEAGLRYHFDEINRRHTYHSYLMSGASADQLGMLVPSETAPSVVTLNRGASHAISAHVIDSIEFGRWTLSPGVRLEGVFSRYEDELSPETDNSRSQWGILPGMGAHFSWTQELGLLAGVYRGFGPVAPEGRSPDAPAPKPESSTTFELGGRFSTNKSFVELVGYFNRYDNLTANCSQSQGCDVQSAGRQFDGGRADVFGLETVLAAQPSAGKFQFPLRLTGTLTWGRFRQSFVSDNPEWGNVQVGDELPYLPRVQGNISAGLEYDERIFLDLSSTFVSAARESAGQGKIEAGNRTDPYALLGVGARVRLVSLLFLYAKATNLFDDAYLVSRRPHGARPGAPRWVQAGLKFDY